MFDRHVKKEFPAVIVFTSLKNCVKFAQLVNTCNLNKNVPYTFRTLDLTENAQECFCFAAHCEITAAFLHKP
jgi:hypothetical protein